MFIIRHDYYKKIHLKLFRDIFHFWEEKKKIMLYNFFCIYLCFLIYFIVFDNKTYIFVFAN